MRIRIPTQITPPQAIALQQRLAPLVKEEDNLPKKLSNIIGCDATYILGMTIAAAVSVDYNTLKTRRVKAVKNQTTFPYIPGLLGFREGPAVLRAARALKPESYVCMVDGHGLAHPRRFGLACLVGLALDRPTIGVAKNLLYGSVRGSRVEDENGRRLAELITLPRNGKTIYVSVGHKISLNEAVQIVKHCLTPHGPIPIRLAHEEVTKRKWQIQRSNQVSS
jgi:deoxyribonuclease V